MKRAIAVAAALLAASAASAQAQTATPPPAEQQGVNIVQQQIAQLGEFCGVFKNTDAEHTSYIPIPGFTILHGQPPFSAPPGSLDAVVCDRPTLMMGINDHRVLTDMHVPLFIRSGGRIFILEVQDGHFAIRFTQGRPTAQEQQQLAAAIDLAHGEVAARQHASQTTPPPTP